MLTRQMRWDISAPCVLSKKCVFRRGTQKILRGQKYKRFEATNSSNRSCMQQPQRRSEDIILLKWLRHHQKVNRRCGKSFEQQRADRHKKLSLFGRSRRAGKYSSSLVLNLRQRDNRYVSDRERRKNFNCKPQMRHPDHRFSAQPGRFNDFNLQGGLRASFADVV